MATFNPTVNPTNDPSYLGMSQGTDRAALQPLASVPELSTKYTQPDYKADTSAGHGLKGLGELGDAAVKLTDQVIQEKAGKTLRDGINEIRDSFGVAQAADQGSKLAPAIGRGGAEGLSLTDADPNAGQPLAIARMGNRVEGLQEAYRQGELSNSAYYAKLEAFVKQTKAQFPGYEDVIDSKVSNIVGTTPANALRSSLLNDVSELQKKVQASVDKRTAQEHADSAYIHTVWPNYEADKAAGKSPSWEEVQMKVGQLKAREWSFTAKSAALGADKAQNEAVSSKAGELSIEGLTNISNNLVLSTTNSFGIKTPDDFQQLLNDVQSGKRPPLTPDEKTAVTGIFAQMKQQYAIQAEKLLNKPLADGSTETLTSKLGNPTRRKDLIAQGQQTLLDLEDGIVNEKHGVMVQTSNWVKATSDAGEADFLRRAPVAAAAAAGRKFYGDQGNSMLLLYEGPLKSAMLEGYRQWNQGAIAQGDGSIRKSLDVFKENGQTDGKLWKAAIQDGVNTILQSDKVENKDAAKNAVNHLFGPDNRTLIETWRNDPGSQVVLFSNMVSKPMVDKVKTLDPSSKRTFTDWATDSFASVYATTANGANSSATNYSRNQNLKLEYDDKSASFTYKGSMTTPASTVQGANAGLTPLNTAISTMKEVWKMEKKDPTQELHYLLPVIGIQPGTPLYNALDKKFRELNPPAEPKAG